MAEATQAAGTAGGAGGAGSARLRRRRRVAGLVSLAYASLRADHPARAAPLSRQLLLQPQLHFQGRPLLLTAAGGVSAVSAPDGRPGGKGTRRPRDGEGQTTLGRSAGAGRGGERRNT